MLDLIGLLRELSSTGISDFVIVGVALLVVRFWLSEMRSELRQEMSNKFGELRQEMNTNTNELREEIDTKTGEVRLASEQGHKEILLHLIDVRERLANIEGRMGIYPPRRGVEPPIPELATEPESGERAQSQSTAP